MMQNKKGGPFGDIGKFSKKVLQSRNYRHKKIGQMRDSNPRPSASDLKNLDYPLCQLAEVTSLVWPWKQQLITLLKVV